VRYLDPIVARLALPCTEARGRRIVYARSGGWCEACDRRAGAEWHHRINRSQGGTWSPANGLHLCAPCHYDVTFGRPRNAREQGWTVLPGRDPAQERVWMAARGAWCLLSAAGDVTELSGSWWGRSPHEF
jgi:hypothetical protein